MLEVLVPALLGAAPAAAHAAESPTAADITVLTYNVRGLPWPAARNRAHALKAIGEELAGLRREGRQPSIVLIQEGFRGEVADLVARSGYRYWAQGPARDVRSETPSSPALRALRSLKYARKGEGWGKFVGAGLHVLSDLPIMETRTVAYRACAGWDCLANKGAMLVRVRVPGEAFDLDVVNTHLNSKKASSVPRARASLAHNMQTDELLRFVAANRGDGPMVVGGDFNVKGAPERYYYRAETRPFVVVSEYCRWNEAACTGEAEGDEPWLRSQDLQAFGSGGKVTVRPLAISDAFGPGADGRRLSDHDGYMVRYRLTWGGETAALEHRPALQP